MGAGKTTFIDQFREKSDGFMVFDLDLEVANYLKIGQGELGAYINKHGLLHFRELEMKILKSLLMKRTQNLIALGGGSIEANGFWEIKDAAKLVFLDVDFERCFSRIKNDLNRPMAQKSAQEVKDLYDLRRTLYLKSDLILNESQIKGIDSIQTLMHNLMST